MDLSMMGTIHGITGNSSGGQILLKCVMVRLEEWAENGVETHTLLQKITHVIVTIGGFPHLHPRPHQANV